MVFMIIQYRSVKPGEPPLWLCVSALRRGTILLSHLDIDKVPHRDRYTNISTGIMVTLLILPVTPRTDIQQFNDREITTAYLLTLKRAGRENAWSAMESSNPDVNTFDLMFAEHG